MTMEADFRAIIADDATVAGLVSTRIYPSTYAQATSGTAIRYEKVTGADGLHMQGVDGLWQDVMQVDIRAATAADALAVRNALAGAPGAAGLLNPFRGTKNTTRFRLIKLRDDRGVVFDDTGPTSYYTASIDFDVTSRAV